MREEKVEEIVKKSGNFKKSSLISKKINLVQKKLTLYKLAL